MPRDGGTNTQLDMDKIAKALGAERCGSVTTGGGHIGAMQLLADIEARFRVHSAGRFASEKSPAPVQNARLRTQ
jgi:hypothetical protein